MLRSLWLLPLFALLLAGCPVTDDDDSAGADDSDATLATLVIHDGAADADLTLTPAFDPDTADYTAEASAQGAVLTVSGTTSQTVFIVVVNGATADYPDDNSFAGASSLNLNAPATVTVGVTAPDGETTMTYTVDVTAP
jgi:hypothetical protein